MKRTAKAASKKGFTLIELAGSVRDAAKLAQVYASATTTKINLITGKAIGAAYAAFDSALSPPYVTIDSRPIR